MDLLTSKSSVLRSVRTLVIPNNVRILIQKTGLTIGNTVLVFSGAVLSYLELAPRWLILVLIATLVVYLLVQYLMNKQNKEELKENENFICSLRNAKTMEEYIAIRTGNKRRFTKNLNTISELALKNNNKVLLQYIMTVYARNDRDILFTREIQTCLYKYLWNNCYRNDLPGLEDWKVLIDNESFLIIIDDDCNIVPVADVIRLQLDVLENLLKSTVNKEENRDYCKIVLELIESRRARLN
jgi:Ca2+/Na+ antiporter